MSDGVRAQAARGAEEGAAAWPRRESAALRAGPERPSVRAGTCRRVARRREAAGDVALTSLGARRLSVAATKRERSASPSTAARQRACAGGARGGAAHASRESQRVG